MAFKAMSVAWVELDESKRAIVRGREVPGFTNNSGFEEFENHHPLQTARILTVIFSH